MKKKWGLPDLDQFPTDDSDWILFLLDNTDAETRDKLLLVLWRAWYVRNQITHNEPNHSVSGSIVFLESLYELMAASNQRTHTALEKGKAKIAQRGCSPMPELGAQLAWQRPPAGIIKLMWTPLSFRTQVRRVPALSPRTSTGRGC